MCRSVPAVGKAADSLYPKIPTAGTFGDHFAPRAGNAVGADFVAIPEGQCVTTFKEQYELECIQTYKANSEIHKSNQIILIATRCAEGNTLRSNKLGRWTTR